MTYQLYKPLRNHLRQYELLESLGVVRGYMQYLQFGQAMSADIQVDPHFYSESTLHRGVNEWELELLIRELILNAQEESGKDLRPWKNFSSAINKIKELENNIVGYSEYRRLYEENILLEFYRMAHRQFPWQRKPNKRAIIRYFKIFSHTNIEAILKNTLGMDARSLYTMGLLVTGFFLDKFGLNYPFTVDMQGITIGDIEKFIGHFSIEMDVLRERIKQQQCYDQDYAYTMNPLLITPLVWATLHGRRALICPIPTYLYRRFTEGVYYEICNDTNFSSAFGDSFQSYVGEVLTSTTNNATSSVLSESQYHAGKDLKHSVDWILADNTATLFIECKTKKVRYGAKIGLADTSILDEDLEKMATFVIQTYKTLSDARQGLYPHWKPNELPIFPIVVTLEEWYAFGDKILLEIDKRVRGGMAKIGLDPAMLEEYPYSVCSVEEMEAMAGVMSKVGIANFMRRKNEREYRLWPYHSFLYQQYLDEMKTLPPLFPEAEREIHPEI